DGDRRRVGSILRARPRRRHRHPAAGMVALCAELVSRGLRLRRGGADGVAARRAHLDPPAASPRRRFRRLPQSAVPAAECREMTDFLEVQDMRKSYGAIQAVDGVSLSVGPGEIVGVIGPNGSGKTTLFNAILGQIKPNAGHVEFCGEDITGLAPLALSRRGVGRTFHSLQVFAKLAVRDNPIAAAQETKGSPASRLFAAPDAGLGGRADEMMELFRLGHVAQLPAGSLSYGQQKLIDIAMAFMPA